MQWLKAWSLKFAGSIVLWLKGGADYIGLTGFFLKILTIVMLMIKTIIVFVINFHFYMLFFRADDYIREILGEVFGANTGFEGAMERVAGRFGINNIT